MVLRQSRRSSPGRALVLALGFVFLASAAAASGRAPEKPFDRHNRQGNQFLVRSAELAGLEGMRIVRQLSTPDGQLFLVEADATAQEHLRGLTKDAGSSDTPHEPVNLAALPQPSLALADPLTEASADLSRQGSFSSPCINYYLGSDVWSGYAGQSATDTIRLHISQVLSGYYCGAGMTVAVIDTGVDPDHPLLQGALMEGYDFLDGKIGASEWTSLDTRTWAIVESEMEAALASTSAATLAGEGQLAILDSMATILGQEDLSTLGSELEDLPPYFGHGTMVAGLVRLTAPGASILPLRVFDESGFGHPFDIVSAIYYAVSHGADVINMSFSMDEYSAEIEAAVEYARHHGVMTVAAAGNDGQEVLLFPAAYPATIGVASTDQLDQLTPFTNYGLITADIAAPGSALVTLYPGGYFAVGWGTSFSAPLVSGITAVTRAYQSGSNKGSHKHTRLDVLLGSWYYNYLWDYILASGRLDAIGALYYAVQ